MAAVLKTAPSECGEMLVSPPRTATGVNWAFAPDWLTIEEACFLGGHDRGFMLQLIEGGGVDLDDDGLIEKRSLWEWQETSAELAHWDEP